MSKLLNRVVALETESDSQEHCGYILTDPGESPESIQARIDEACKSGQGVIVVPKKKERG